jgi:hypothetical protein
MTNDNIIMDVLNQTNGASLLQNTTNSPVLGSNISFHDACNQSSVYGNCNEGTGLDGGSIAAFTILTTIIVLGWFFKSCCFCCFNEKNSMQSMEQGYGTESESSSDKSSVSSLDEEVPGFDEVSTDRSVPRA